VPDILRPILYYVNRLLLPMRKLVNTRFSLGNKKYFEVLEMAKTGAVGMYDVAPEAVPNYVNKSVFYRRCISEALRQGLKPADFPPQDGPAGLIYKTTQVDLQEMRPKVEAIAAELDMAMMPVVSGLVLAGLPFIETADLASANLKPAKQLYNFKTKRHLQQVFYDATNRIMRHPTQNIAIAEASTGVGKGRAIMALAVDAVMRKAGPVVVTAPTIALCHNLLQESEELIKDPILKKSNLKIGFLPAWAEFVDNEALEQWLDAYETHDAEDTEDEEIRRKADLIYRLRHWIEDNGAPPVETALVRSMRGMGLNPAWLTSSLKEIAPEAPYQDFVFKEKPKVTKRMKDSPKAAKAKNEEDLLPDGAKAALECRRNAAGVDIVVCTHAMLGVCYKLKWYEGGVPKPKTLLVDEAHLLEQNIAGVYSDGLSLFGFKSALKREIGSFIPEKLVSRKGSEGKVAVPLDEKLRRLIRKVVNFEKYLKSLDSSDRPNAETRISSSVDDGLRNDVLVHLQGMEKAIKAMPGRSHELAVYFKRVSDLMKKIERDAPTSRIFLKFSPDRLYPSIVHGPASVNYHLAAIWRDTISGAAVSATLTTINSHDGADSSHIATLLGIPASRRDMIVPVVAPWVTDLPTLWLPKASKAVTLCPPPRPKLEGLSKVKCHAALMEHKAEKERWAEALAKTIGAIWRNRKDGGVLALCTSYETVKMVASYLKGRAPAEVIIAARQGLSFIEQEKQYRALYAANKRPLLLGVGTSWTGIDFLDGDFLDHEPEKDNLLTELIITRLPINLNRTSTYQERVDRIGMNVVSGEAQIMLKQGLGRLIRREGVLNRNIWFLDGRLFNPERRIGIPILESAVKNMFRRYKKVCYFK
jgi:ATP-dependent DNA helicase DinG